MSDISQGEGWWQASDLKWYPPDLHPNYDTAPVPEQETPPAPAPAPTSEPEPVAAPIPEPVPVYEPPLPQQQPQPVAAAPPPAPMAPPPAGGGNTKWIVVGVVAVAVLAVGAFLLFGGSDSKKDDVASSNTGSGKSTSSSSSSRSTDSSSSAAPITAAELQARMLSARDVGATFKDGTFALDDATPTPCGQPNLNTQVPPRLDVGSQATDAVTKAFFREEVSEYDDAATARRAFDLGTQGFSCTQGTLSNGAALTLSAPKDVSSTFGQASVSIGFEVSGTTGELIAVLVDNRIVSMQFQAPTDANRSALPDSVTIVKRGLTKLDG